MNLEKLIVPTLIILAVTGMVYRATRAPLAEKELQTQTPEQVFEEVSGMLTYGNEVRSFLPCGKAEQDAAWMVFANPSTGAIVREKYELITDDRIPYTPVFAKLSVEAINPPTEGFGAEYSSAVIVHELIYLETDSTCLDEEIKLEYPKTGGPVSSPLAITGSARGSWFFEGKMDAVLTNWNGEIIGETVLEAEDDWMTEEFVSFSGELTFTTPQYGQTGHFIIQAANPSGLPENDRALEIIVEFAQNEDNES